MQSKTLVLAFFVLIGVILGALVWAKHSPSLAGAKARRAALPENAGGDGGPVKAARAVKKAASGAGVVTELPAVAGEGAGEPVVASGAGAGAQAVDGVTVVPVSGTLNASGPASPAQRKSLIPSPDEGSAGATAGDR